MKKIFNVERYKNRSQRQRAKQLRQALRNTGNWTCHLCGKRVTTINATVDHLRPLALNGPKRVASNVRLACRRCNSRRGMQPVHFFKMTLYLLQFPCLKANYNERISRRRR
jgi:5-methylcytosine-specific restriction endonuclease McrA